MDGACAGRSRIPVVALGNLSGQGHDSYRFIEEYLIMDKVAVLVPCYNEEQTIEKVIRDFRNVLPEAVIYVYDNNSKDRTAEIAQAAGAVVRHEYQQGKGNVLRRMFGEIEAQCYLIVDGDDTYPAENAPEMVDRVLNHNADMVVGDRLSSTYFEENKRPFHNFGNTIVRASINLLFKNNIKDIMTGYRAFSYRYVKTFPVLSKGFEIETEMSIHAIDKNLQVENVIIQYRDRPEGSESKLNTYSDGMKVLGTIRKLFGNYRPMAFYGAICAFLILLAVVFFVPIMIDYAKTGLVDRFPTLIVCGFVVLAAIISFFAGMLLQSIYQNTRRQFEMDLYEAMRQERELLSQREKTTA